MKISNNIIGSALIVLNLLCSCEKAEIPSSAEEKDSNLELTVHVTGFDITYSDMDTRSSETSASRISFVVTDESGNKILTIEQEKDDTDTFGTFDCKLPAGTYTLVAVVHSSTKPAKISGFDVAFDGDIVTDTFIAKTQIVLTGDTPVVSVDMTATRVVALFRLTCNDLLPDSIKSFHVTISKGDNEFNFSDNHSVLDKPHRTFHGVNEADRGKTGYTFDTYTFLQTRETTVNIEVSAIDMEGRIIKTVCFNDIKLGINKKTDARGSFFIQKQAVGISIDESWSATESIEF